MSAARIQKLEALLHKVQTRALAPHERQAGEAQPRRRRGTADFAAVNPRQPQMAELPLVHADPQPVEATPQPVEVVAAPPVAAPPVAASPEVLDDAVTLHGDQRAPIEAIEAPTLVGKVAPVHARGALPEEAQTMISLIQRSLRLRLK